MSGRYTLEGVVRRYRESRTGRMIEALRVPDLSIAAGEIVAIVGPNGSGKSTLLETMAFLVRPEEGRVRLDGCDVWETGQVLAARRRCPMLLQRTVLFQMSVRNNVAYGLRLRGADAAQTRRRTTEVLRLLELEHLADRGPRELSGGECQRVALARTLALEPEVLLLDEPTAHVDQASERVVGEALRELHARLGTTVILASHRDRQTTAWTTRVLTLVDGRVVASANRSTVPQPP